MALSSKADFPRVFISYSWDDDSHKAWVAKLATRLRADGVNVILDQWEVRLGDQLPQFMESSVRNSDFVLIICTPRYKERCDPRRGGVGYEEQVITAEGFYAQNDRKFIPVLRLGEWKDVAPSWLLGKDFADLRGEFPSESEYQELKNTIHQMLPEAPPIGPKPSAPKAIPPKQLLTVPFPKSQSSALIRFYTKLAGRGEECLSNGDIEVAPYLDDLTKDLRYGLTLIVRPSPQIAASFNSVVADLRRACPTLFGYDNCRFHFTVLSLVTAAETFRRETEPLEAYRTVIQDVLSRVSQFTVEFRGVCATPNSIIAKGYPVDSGLESIRAELRQALKAAGLGRGVDERYRIRGAHVVLARFSERSDFSPLQALLKQITDRPLGRMNVRQCQLVVNDFYMSVEKIQVLAEFPNGPIHNLPSRPPRFIGRKSECNGFLDLLVRSTAPVIIASGFGGIGKSALAAQVAYRCLTLGREYFEFIIWVDLRKYNESQSVTLDHVLNMILMTLDPDRRIPAVSELEQKKQLVTQLLALHRSLLLLDNYESVLESVYQDDEIGRFIKSLPMDTPQGICIRILVTTRIVSSGLKNLRGSVGLQDVPLTELPQKESVEFMKDVSAGRRIKLSDEQYLIVATRWRGLPKYMQVAIDQLAVIPFGEWEKITEIVPDDWEQDRVFGDLFGVSWNRILSNDAKYLLMAMTYFVGDASFDAVLIITGLPRPQLMRALEETSPAYLERGVGDLYGIHPLTHLACRKFLRSGENAEFHHTAGRRFVEYYLEIAEGCNGADGTEVLLREVRNIVAAAQLAGELREWNLLVRFRPAMFNSLRIRGFWDEERQVCELARTASIELRDFRSLAHCLVDDLAWIYLRLEQMDQAEQYAREGLGYFEELGDRSGIAQAWRQLGKAALLRGEYDSSADGGRTSQKYFEESDRAYHQSLRYREDLQRDAIDQRERIADMKLDFGRLYWLRGRKYEILAREEASASRAILDKALSLYEQAKTVSQEALDSFIEVESTRGIAKALGNIGNAVKEKARFLERSGQVDEAESLMREAQQNYNESLKNAEIIQRKDEIAHAYWGLAEVLEFLSGRKGLSFEDRREVLSKAFSFAQKSHDLYASLGGPFDQRTTRALAKKLESELIASSLWGAAGVTGTEQDRRTDLFAWLQREGVQFDALALRSVFRQLALGPATGLRMPDMHSPAPTLPKSRLRVLTAICQKIGSTGSGVVVREVVDRVAESGAECLVICAAEENEAFERVFRSSTVEIRPILFNSRADRALPYAIPGMSDRMPYESMRFLDLNFEQLSIYLSVWRSHIFDAVQSFRPHLIHVHHLWLLAAVCAAVAPGVPIVVSVHGTDLHRARQCSHLASLVAPWTGCFSRFLALTEESATEATSLYSLPIDRIIVMGNGYNDALFAPKRIPDMSTLTKYGLEELPGQRVILFVGKYVEWKGIEWLLRAFARLNVDGDSGATLVIGGTGPEVERQRYIDLARELEIADHVILTGQISYEDVGELMNIASVFVLPSYCEPFGLVLLEALACGSRVVSTNQAGPASFVPRSLVSSRDAILINGLAEPLPAVSERESFVYSLSIAISEQVAKPLSFERRCEISASVSHLTWDSYVQRVTGVYRRLISGEDGSV